MMNVASPIRQCGWLLIVGLIAMVVLSAPALLLAGWAGLQGLGLSAIVCLIPGLVTVGLVSSVKHPATRIWLTVGGMMVRMLFVLVVALVVHQVRPQLGLLEFYIWLLVFYNVLLLAETWLLLPRASEQ